VRIGNLLNTDWLYSGEVLASVTNSIISRDGFHINDWQLLANYKKCPNFNIWRQASVKKYSKERDEKENFRNDK